MSALPLPATPQPAAELPFSEFSQAIETRTVRTSRHDRRPLCADLPIFDLPRTPSPLPPPASTLRLTVPDTHGSLPIEAEPLQSMHSLTDLRPLGQIHNSFIIAAGKDGLWIIDQHVAHERILFEKVLKQRTERWSGDVSSC